MGAGFIPDVERCDDLAPIRLRDTRRPGSALLVTTVLCLGLAIGGSVVGIIETLAPARCVATGGQ